ncbi:MAG TPA: zf-HC2 domain-containing protein, partial [Pyrinomonadaceae bacterium]
MRDTFGKNDCGRGDQLVGYLYHESEAAERADFERHLRDCAACREELAALAHVRGSVAEFRDELIRAAPPVSLAAFAAGSDAQPTAARSADTHTPHASPPGETGSRAPHAVFAPPADGVR